MSDETRLVAEPRTLLGTSAARRLRRSGRTPGNVYGHGEGSVAISVTSDQLARVVETGHHVIDLQMDGKPQTAMFREVQWDTFGTHIKHFDLIRVSADERVTVEVQVEMRGVSPGVTAGGILDLHLRTIAVECLVLQVPDAIIVNVNHLEIGDSVHIRDLEMPANVMVQASADELVLQINAPSEIPELEEGDVVPGPAEPEVIGAKDKEDAEAG